ncbi:MAG: ribonuclease P protein component [Patescibacteria group bacterium]
MLPRPRRLHRERDILRVLRTGPRKQGRLVQLVVTPSAHVVSRATVVVAKSVHKRAVVRNQVRRRLQALLPTFLPRTPEAIDVLVRALPASATATSATFRTELTALWPTHAPRLSPRASQPHRRHPRVPARPLARP